MRLPGIPKSNQVLTPAGLFYSTLLLSHKRLHAGSVVANYDFSIPTTASTTSWFRRLTSQKGVGGCLMG